MDQQALIEAPEPQRAAHVARVLIDSALPHLDRPFDYLIPPSMREQVQPGVRVKVPFGGRQLAGFVLEVIDELPVEHKLKPLAKLVSPTVALHPEIARLAQAVAERYAGTLWDVVRLAVPARAARVETEQRELRYPELPPRQGQLDEYAGGAESAGRWAAGQAHRAVVTWAPNNQGSWPGFLLDACLPVLAAGRRALIVVPDARDLQLLAGYLDSELGPESYARLHADDGPTPRYRNYLKAIGGEVPLVIGTRAAALCHVPDLGLMIIWQDDDASHREQRAPYPHARQIALLRSQLDEVGLLIAGTSRSVEAQRLVATDWAQELKLPRALLRERAPRVVVAASDFELERDPVLARARIPALAWREASAALKHGPVLVQVARTGFMPAIACQNCRSLARCLDCQGPLQLSSSGAALSCRWCARTYRNYACQTCGSTQIRAASVGSERTADELGQAFPSVPVLSSTGAKPLFEVPDRPALVVSTPGVEPVAEAGYRAVLLLDAQKMLAHDALRNAEQVLARWFAAASLARGDGVVVLTGDPSVAGAALIRYDPAGFAERELAERREVGLPPAVRSAIVSGPGAGLLVRRLQAPVQVHGPTILEGPPLEHRYVLFFSYADGPAVTGQLRSLRAQMAAAKEPVAQVSIDPDQVL